MTSYSKSMDLTGLIIGKLLVLEKSQNRKTKNGTSAVYWKCKCDCGKIIDIYFKGLLTKTTKSCGCLKIEHISKLNKKTFGESASNSLFARYKRSAKKRNINFELTLKQFYPLLIKECEYCGDTGISTWRRSETYGNFKYNGIDRINNSLGYTIDNIITCCVRCNTAKSTMSKSEFFETIKKIYERHKLDEKQ